MFGFFKEKNKDFSIGAPVKGMAVPVSEVKDPTFGEEILGKGIAIKPTDGNIYAPVDGEIALLFDTLHAVSIISEEGAEVLIHIGLETVALNGDGFQAHTKTGAKVKKGDLLITVDLDKVKAAGCDTITPIVICNTADYANVKAIGGKEVQPGEDVIVITKK